MELENKKMNIDIEKLLAAFSYSFLFTLAICAFVLLFYCLYLFIGIFPTAIIFGIFLTMSIIIYLKSY
ncbi:MAG: hypothetical protein BV456_01755 [Thermoplasmata archaeon M8B2D]|nr:MAG: hypothetical protein BV456_01755 [Thermoplasmata archaeon M8B2D]